MRKPIQKGDLCLVVGGLNQERSPNIGKLVTVSRFRGDFYMDQPIWECRGEGIIQTPPGTSEQVVTGWADFPQSWLQKIDPTETKVKDEQSAELHV